MKAKAKKRAKKREPAAAPFWLLVNSQSYSANEDHVQLIIELRRKKP